MHNAQGTKHKAQTIGDAGKAALIDIAISEKALLMARLISDIRGDMLEEEAELALWFISWESAGNKVKEHRK